VHRQWHGKEDGDPCAHLSLGRRDHMSHAILLRAAQLDVDHELVTLLQGQAPPLPKRVVANRIAVDDLRRWLFRGDHLDPDISSDDGDQAEMQGGGTVDLYDAANQTSGSASTREALALTLAKKTAPNVKLLQGSADVTTDQYLQAVVPQYAGARGSTDPKNPGADMAHKDFDQMVYSARYPGWVYERRAELSSDDLLRDKNWDIMVRGAQRIVTNRLGGGTAVTRAFFQGNAKYLYPSEISNVRTFGSQGQMYLSDFAQGENGRVWWENSGSPSYVARSGRAIPDWYAFVSEPGKGLRDALYETSGEPGRGRMYGQGTDDTGHVFAEFTVASACAASCNTLREDVDERAGRNGNWNRGDGEAPRGIHFFHGEAPHLGHRSGALNQSTDHSYIGHMRFAATNRPDDLWGMPRTVVMLAEPVKEPGVSFNGKAGWRPWDFDFSATKFFGDWSFKTVNSRGDTAANDEMAAVAGGLVYYHQAQAWEEPPNLWNPFWRAKLHPLKAAHVAQGGHAATAAAVGALGQRYVHE
jgi:hypothetical protein